MSRLTVLPLAVLVLSACAHPESSGGPDGGGPTGGDDLSTGVDAGRRRA